MGVPSAIARHRKISSQRRDTAWDRWPSAVTEAGAAEVVGTGGGTTTYTHNPPNWLASASDGTSFTHDNNGNITAEGSSISYTYTGGNRVASITASGTTVNYTYDGDNKRVKAAGADTFDFYYTPLGMTLERKNSTDHGRYVRFPNGMPLAITSPDGTFYYLIDRSGNVVGMINSVGTVDWYGYRPFGEVLSQPGTPKYNPE